MCQLLLESALCLHPLRKGQRTLCNARQKNFLTWAINHVPVNWMNYADTNTSDFVGSVLLNENLTGIVGLFRCTCEILLGEGESIFFLPPSKIRNNHSRKYERKLWWFEFDFCSQCNISSSNVLKIFNSDQHQDREKFIQKDYSWENTKEWYTFLDREVLYNVNIAAAMLMDFFQSGSKGRILATKVTHAIYQMEESNVISTCKIIGLHCHTFTITKLESGVN